MKDTKYTDECSNTEQMTKHMDKYISEILWRLGKKILTKYTRYENFKNIISNF